MTAATQAIVALSHCAGGLFRNVNANSSSDRFRIHFENVARWWEMKSKNCRANGSSSGRDKLTGRLVGLGLIGLGLALPGPLCCARLTRPRVDRFDERIHHNAIR